MKGSRYQKWGDWEGSGEEKGREWVKGYILEVWKRFKFYGYGGIGGYSEVKNECGKICEYMRVKLMGELGIR